jgi:hypothetical protein
MYLPEVYMHVYWYAMSPTKCNQFFLFVWIEGDSADYQCRALKYPSGKIECVYKSVSANKEGEWNEHHDACIQKKTLHLCIWELWWQNNTLGVDSTPWNLQCVLFVPCICIQDNEIWTWL